MSNRTKCKTWIRLNMQINKYNPINKASRIETHTEDEVEK